MFELEARESRLRLQDVADEVIAAFRGHPVDAPYRSIHVWEEHCTECAFPDCYKTCDLFEPRTDGNCRRFRGGVVPVDGLKSGGAQVVKITFKRWANMYSKGVATLVPEREAARFESRTRFASEILRRVPDGGLHFNEWPGPFARAARRLRRSGLNKIIEKHPSRAMDAFVIQIYVPGDVAFDATFSISGDSADTTRPFQKRLVLDPGFHHVEIAMAEIAAVLGSGHVDFMSLIPNTEGGSSDTVYLGFIGFIGGEPSLDVAKEQASIAANSPEPKSVKVMVWDLDHTLWDGILVEDGPDEISLKPGVVEIVRKLDSRGIVNSVASKNDPEPTLAALKHFGLSEYFVFPQVGWQPKSQSLTQIISDFNIGANTVAFIDDQPFERSEVSSVHPDVRVYDAADYRSILELPEFNPEISSESASRRLHYINEGVRRSSAAGYSGDDYEEFLRDCDLHMKILRGVGQNVDRIYELTQRTNQMNFSGTRYERVDITRMLSDSAFDAFSLRCQDKFGDYGTVGFGLVALPEGPDDGPRVVDLAFSCRVQAKRAEHAFFAWLCESYNARGFDKLQVRYVPTARNKAVAAVFDDMGFDEIVGSQADHRLMVLDTDKVQTSRYPWAITFEDHRQDAARDDQ